MHSGYNERWENDDNFSYHNMMETTRIRTRSVVAVKTSTKSEIDCGDVHSSSVVDGLRNRFQWNILGCGAH
ncbi:hypothetical protein Y032_0047g1491 [Ancylostoma ceylanicum]|uniref:Uncharacterized protein n=1 Tax=Ancylostoma ceylanicum TaxID=53326 RepID=A0A016UC98_9BILA|nr:hypothetical protein Y032_0047g1491 [Ancylostoma ceylanicum]